MEKPSKITVAGIRILIISIFCFGSYLLTQSLIFGNELNGNRLMVGTICSFLVGVFFHLYLKKKEKGITKNEK